ncbi:MAG: nicotinamide mononucleotide transporter [Bacteroidales bacterium]|nr:nicotinamide mononucleotide transporter [Bacteroidales bacterium]
MALINRNTLSTFDWFLIAGVIASSLGYSFLTSSFDTLGIIASITGVVCVVLCAKGNILNYAFGLVNVTIYAWISFKAQLYGDAALNALYYFPMNIIGWLSWNNRRQIADETKVKARRMTPGQRVLLTGVCVVTVAVCGIILSKVGDPQPYKDSATTMLSIIAMFLMVRAFMEQWALWILTNVISVAMWIILTVRGDSHAVMMVIMYVFYTINSINGLVQWKKLAANDVE